MADTQEYSPLNPQPYQPTQAPPTPEAKPSPLQDSPGFQFQGHGNISHAGAIAGVFDNVLKGYVNGHAQGEAHKALLQKKKSDDLNQSYNQDAQRLYQMKVAGVDEKSPEYQAAKSAVDGSWGALQDYRGSLLEQHGGGKKKTKSSTGQQGDTDVLAQLTSKDPVEKARAIFMMSQKLGPPVYGQIAALNTPQAQQARATQQTGADTSQAAGETNNKLATMANQIATLSTKEHLTPEEETQLGDLKKRYTDLNATLHPQKVPTSGGLKRYRKDAKGNTLEYMVDAQGNEIPDTERPLSTAQAPKPVRAWTKDKSGKFTSVMVDPTTNQTVPGSENGDIAPPASLSGHVTQGFHYWVDSENQIHQLAETKTTTPMAQSAGSTPPPPSVPPAASPAPSSAAPTRRERTRTPSATPPTPPAPPTGPKGDHIIGQKGSAEETAAKKNADTLQLAAQNSLQRMKNPTPIGDTGIVMGWVRAQVSGAGRMTQQEIQQAVQSGSFGTKFQNAYDRATKGTLDPTFRRQMVEDTMMAARQARILANSYKPKTTAAAESKGIVTIDDAMKLPKYHGKSRDEVSAAITAQGYTPQ